MFHIKTSKDGAECRHDMRPSVQLPTSQALIVNGQASLQSTPEPPELDPPPVSKHVRQMWGSFLSFLACDVL